VEGPAYENVFFLEPASLLLEREKGVVAAANYKTSPLLLMSSERLVVKELPPEANILHNIPLGGHWGIGTSSQTCPCVSSFPDLSQTSRLQVDRPQAYWLRVSPVLSPSEHGLWKFGRHFLLQSLRAVTIFCKVVEILLSY